MFDRDVVKDRQGRALRLIVASMLAMLPGFPVGTLRRAVHLRVLETLRPAEAAARRLIAVLAGRIEVTPSALRRVAPPSGPIPRGSGERAPVFRLFDPRKCPVPQAVGGGGRAAFARGRGPGMTLIGWDEHVAAPDAPAAPSPDDPVSGRAICRRLAALKGALDDLPKQARRLARVLARGKAKWHRVMRPGRPPGHRTGGTRAVDEVLRDCHWFALTALREEKVPP